MENVHDSFTFRSIPEDKTSRLKTHFDLLVAKVGNYPKSCCLGVDIVRDQQGLFFVEHHLIGIGIGIGIGIDAAPPILLNLGSAKKTR